jgi:hypothetical protein
MIPTSSSCGRTLDLDNFKAQTTGSLQMEQRVRDNINPQQMGSSLLTP